MNTGEEETLLLCNLISCVRASKLSSAVVVGYKVKGSVQHCIKSEIDVLRKEAWNGFKLVIYIRISMWPNDEIIMIALIS